MVANAAAGEVHYVDNVFFAPGTLSISNYSTEIAPSLTYSFTASLVANYLLPRVPGNQVIADWTATNCTLSAGTPIDGGFFAGSSLEMTATATGTMSASSPPYPVVAGEDYTVQINFLAASTSESVTAALEWYNSSGTLLSTSSTTAVTDSSTEWVTAEGLFTAPANAAWAKVSPQVPVSAVGEIHYADAFWSLPVRSGTFNAYWYDANNTFVSISNIENGNIANGILAGSSQAPATAASVALQVGGSSCDQPIFAPPAPSVTVNGTAGTTDYYYRVSAVSLFGETTPSLPTEITTGNATLSSTNYNAVTWNAVTGAVSYPVYRSTDGTNYYQVANVAGNTMGAGTFTWDDTGAVATTAVPQTTNYSGYSIYIAKVGIFPPGSSGTWSVGGYVGAQQSNVYYSTDGITWVYPATSVYAGQPQLVGTVTLDSVYQKGIVYDWHAQPVITTYYQAQVVSSQTSAPTTPKTSSPILDHWWLKDMQEKSNSVPLLAVEPWNPAINEMSGTYRVLGRNRPIVVTDVVMGSDGTFNAVIIGRDNLTKLINAISAQHTFLLHSPFGDHLYIRHAAAPGTSTTASVATFSYSQQFSAIGEEYYTITFDFVEVEAP